jgi:Flp pilus assembly protein protease CpaA
MVLTIFLIDALLLLTHAPVVSILLGLIGGIFVLVAISDVRTGVIPNPLMAVGALCALGLQVSVNGWIDGAIRSGCIVGFWLVFASVRYASNGIGGGDLKMIGVTWLTLGIFPPFAALVGLMSWALALTLILGVMQLRRVGRLRAGPALAVAAIFAYFIAFCCVI